MLNQLDLFDDLLYHFYQEMLSGRKIPKSPLALATYRYVCRNRKLVQAKIITEIP